MKKFLVVSFLFLANSLFAQRIITGKVVDVANGKPLAAASVFLSNTSVGTVSSSDGNFSLNIPEGRYDLVISSVGYETAVQSLLSGQAYAGILVQLTQKVKELESIILEPYDKNGWERWGKFFLENFLGTSDIAKDCRIKNYAVLRFRNSKKNNELTASAFEPLIIENHALGYTIKYQLEGFSYNFKERLIYYVGYPLFEAMEGNERKQARWQKNREEAYYGSIMHFMRSLFRNKLIENGFEVHTLVRKKNEEKGRIQQLLKQSRVLQTNNSGTTITITDQTKRGDSSDYYDKIMRQQDAYDLLSAEPLVGDSIAYASDSVTVEMDFDNYLWINYKPGETPPEYRAQNPDAGKQMISQLFLLHSRPIQIQSNGSYYSPTDLLNMGYWGWSEKISSMLPFDYKPKPNKKAP